VFLALLRARLAVIVAGHLAIFAASLSLAYVIRFDGAIPPVHLKALLWFLPLAVPLKMGVFAALGSHRGWCRYNTFADMLGVARAATIGSLLIAAMAFWRGGWAIPRSVILIDWAGTLLLVGGCRGAMRLFRERYYPRILHLELPRVLIVGASEVGMVLAREIRGNPHLAMQAVGFLDSGPGLKGRVLAGVKVLGSPPEVREIAARFDIQVVLVPTPVVPPSEVRALVMACADSGVRVQVVPELEAVLNGRVAVQPRDVDIHDLLCREPVRLDGEAVGRFLRDRVVLVTGAAGSIGSELCRQALSFKPRRLVLLDHSENGLFYVERELRGLAGSTELVVRVASITDRLRIRTLFETLRPDVVLHAAAHKHVPMMEANPGEAIKNNVFGTRTLLDEALRSDVEAFVMISTDKAVNPTSVMGACKRLAEMYIQARSTTTRARLVTVRFGNVLGSNGSVVPLFKEQIRRGGPITITHPDMTRYFMTIPEATQLVLQAGAQGRGGEIFVLDMGQPVRILDLARDMIRLSGLTEGRDIAITCAGLRPGEKLYEELYDAAEARIPTPHPKIFAARHRASSLPQLEAGLDFLGELVEDRAESVIAGLQALIPEYRPGGVRPGPNGSGASDPTPQGRQATPAPVHAGQVS
jgi:FlaA1/EpsC-like NDP-sugar epimerase